MLLTTWELYMTYLDKHGFDICYKILKKIIETHVDIAELLIRM